MPNINESFLEAINKGYKNYSIHGARSNQKIRPIHGRIGEVLEKMLPKEEGYEIEALGLTDSEGQTPMSNGHMKNTDIRICQNNIIKGFIEVKCAMSSYGKNKQNYQENMIGECAMVKDCLNEDGNEIPVWYMSIIPQHVPNVDNNGKIVSIETFNEEDALSYQKLANSRIGKQVMDVSSTYVIDTGNEEYLKRLKENNETFDISSDDYKNSLKISYSDIDKLYNKKEVKEYITNNFESDMKKFVTLVRNI